MKTYKYVDTNSPSEMTIGMFEMLSTDEANEVLRKITFIANQKNLNAANFAELKYNEDTSDKTYSEALVCPHCHSNDILKNGKDRNQKQRYICQNCKKTFAASSKTLSSNTTQNTGKWLSFIIGLLNCESCEELSRKCDISVPTALFWRVKVFAALEVLAKDVKLTNVIFADDTRFYYNFKGNHGDDFIAPRKSRSRGSQNTIKNYQRNSICVLCAVDSSGHSFSHCIGFGNPSGKRLSNGFKDKLCVNENTVLVTDGAQSYKRVVEDYNIPNWEREITVKKGGKRVPNIHGEFHVQKVNSYHSRLKDFIRSFNSVASRYLPGYLLLFDYIENNKNLNSEEQAKRILKAMSEIPSDTTIEMLLQSYQIPVSNGPETEIWEAKVPKKEQAIYMDWVNKMKTKDICKKHKIPKHKIYTIKNKVEKYGLHDKILNKQHKPIRRTRARNPISERNMEIYLLCHRDGWLHVDVAKKYGISRQRVQQILSSLANRPEIYGIQSFEDKYPKKYSSRETKAKRMAYREKINFEFNLMHSQSFYLNDTYSLLAEMNKSSPRAIHTLLFSQRKAEGKTDTRYSWKPERKHMDDIEYSNYLNCFYEQVKNDYKQLKQINPNWTKIKIQTILAEKYKYAIPSIRAILDNTTPIQPKRKKAKDPQPKYASKTYYDIKTMQNDYPHLPISKIASIVSKKNHLSYETTINYYYLYKRFMQQEQNKVQQEDKQAR